MVPEPPGDPARPPGRPLIRFGAVGLLTTALDFALFAFLSSVAGLLPAAANAVSYSTGVIVSFILNRSWTFGESGAGGARQAVRFGAANLAGLALSTILVAAFATMMPAAAAKLASVPLVFLWNWAAARYWVFRK